MKFKVQMFVVAVLTRVTCDFVCLIKGSSSLHSCIAAW